LNHPELENPHTAKSSSLICLAAGLDQYGLDQGDAKKRLAYTHLDIAGAVEEDSMPSGSLGKCTGAPVVSLSAAFLFPHLA
jgi:hypothetical protein